ncbi:MAG: hypothetical protein GHCLOJNM_03751 [bacterium]|nr:hypothetical protein [bacterium]
MIADMGVSKSLGARVFLGGLFLVLLGVESWGAGALEGLLVRVPADNRADDSNIYSLTDIQTALGADLKWNALLRRAVLIDSRGGVNVSLIVGSNLGRCGSDLVEWPEPPSFRRGEIYVSRALLETVFSHYPDYQLPDQPEETASPTPFESGEIAEGEPEEPPAPPEAGELNLRTLLVVTLPASGLPEGATAVESLLSEWTKTLKENGIRVVSASWNPASPDSSYLEADAMIAIQLRVGDPPPRSSFFFYDSSPSPGGRDEASLVEWSRVSQSYKRDSRAIAELLYRNFVSAFGSARATGLRGGPLQVLQGRKLPSVLVQFGVSVEDLTKEIKKMTEVVGASLAQVRKE